MNDEDMDGKVELLLGIMDMDLKSSVIYKGW